MKKEFGKWLMDVAKYLATAVLISSVFNDLGESAAIYRVGGLTMAMLLGLGLALVKDKPTGKIKKVNPLGISTQKSPHRKSCFEFIRDRSCPNPCHES